MAFRRRLACLTRRGRKSQLRSRRRRYERERFNDGACDGRGRLWIGTMDRHLREPVGALYRIDPDLSAPPNGLGPRNIQRHCMEPTLRQALSLRFEVPPSLRARFRSRNGFDRQPPHLCRVRYGMGVPTDVQSISKAFSGSRLRERVPFSDLTPAAGSPRKSRPLSFGRAV